MYQVLATVGLYFFITGVMVAYNNRQSDMIPGLEHRVYQLQVRMSALEASITEVKDSQDKLRTSAEQRVVTEDIESLLSNALFKDIYSELEELKRVLKDTKCGTE